MPLTAGSKGLNAVHDTINLVFADSLIESGHTTYVEVEGFYGPYPGNLPGNTSGSDRRLDAVGVNTASGDKRSFDVCRTNNATPTRLTGPGDILSASKEAENNKRAKYDKPGDSPPNVTFHPCSVGTQNELGPQARKVVAMLAHLTAKRDCTDGFEPSQAQVDRRRHSLHARIGIANMRGQALIMLALIAGTPEAALAVADRHTHTAVNKLLRTLPRCCCAAPNPGCCVCGGSARSQRTGRMP